MKFLIKFLLIFFIIAGTSYLAYESNKKNYKCILSSNQEEICISKNKNQEDITSRSCILKDCSITKNISKIAFGFLSNPTYYDICLAGAGSLDTVYNIEKDMTLSVDVCRIKNDYIDISMINRFYLHRKW